MQKYTLFIYLFFVIPMNEMLRADGYMSSVASFSEILLNNRPIASEITTLAEEIQPEIKPVSIDEAKECKCQEAIANLEQRIEQLNSEKQQDKQRIEVLEQGLAQCKMHIACISLAIIGGIIFGLYQAGIIQ